MIYLGTVNEKSTALLALDFTDEDGAPVTPTSGDYRIDTESGTPVKASTSFVPTSSHHLVELSVADNTLIGSTLVVEQRIITVKWQYGANKQGTAEYEYNVKNLQNV